MNKADLAAHLATQVALPKAAADCAVSVVFAAIADALARDEAVAIAVFGTFSTRSRAARQSRNPSTGESIAIAASTAPAFEAAKKFRDTVNGGDESAVGTLQPPWGEAHDAFRRCRPCVIRQRQACGIVRCRRAAGGPNPIAANHAVEAISALRAGFQPHRQARIPNAARHEIFTGEHVRGRDESSGLGRFSRPCDHLCSTSADIGCLRRSHSSYREMRIDPDDSSTRACERQILKALPRRLRPPSLTSRSTASFIQHGVPGPTYRPALRRWISTLRDLPRTTAQ